MSEVYCLCHVHVLHGGLTLARGHDLSLKWIQISLFRFAAHILSVFFVFFLHMSKIWRGLLLLIDFFMHTCQGKRFNICYKLSSSGLMVNIVIKEVLPNVGFEMLWKWYFLPRFCLCIWWVYLLWMWQLYSTQAYSITSYCWLSNSIRVSVHACVMILSELHQGLTTISWKY